MAIDMVPIRMNFRVRFAAARKQNSDFVLILTDECCKTEINNRNDLTEKFAKKLDHQQC